MTPDFYEKMLKIIARFKGKKKDALLAMFVQRYRLDYWRTRQDFMHVLTEHTTARKAKQKPDRIRRTRGRKTNSTN